MIKDLNEFISKYDTIGSYVLFSGKRNVIQTDEKLIFELGKTLCLKTKHIVFRTGNAEGADFLFGSGVASVDSSRLQTILPYKGHRKKYNLSDDAINLEDVNLLEEPEIIYESKKNKKTEKLIEKFVAGEKNKIVVKAAYIIRHTLMVLGNQQIPAVAFGFIYDDLLNPRDGGTGHTMKVCETKNIAYSNQSIWSNWIDLT